MSFFPIHTRAHNHIHTKAQAQKYIYKLTFEASAKSWVTLDNSFSTESCCWLSRRHSCRLSWHSFNCLWMPARAFSKSSFKKEMNALKTNNFKLKLSKHVWLSTHFTNLLLFFYANVLLSLCTHWSNIVLWDMANTLSSLKLETLKLCSWSRWSSSFRRSIFSWKI